MNEKTPVISAKGAYAALGAAGFPSAYVKRSLPDWWDNALLKTSAGALQFATILKQRLGVEVRFAPNGEMLVLSGSQRARFKHRAATHESELHVAATIGLALARLAIFSTKTAYQPLPTTAKSLASDVLSWSGQDTVGFENLLDYCWSRGVPVLFLKELPKTSKRVTGMAVQVDQRPAIVLGLNSPQNARQLFVLAHELAHVCLGHVGDSSVLVDEGLAAVTDSLEGAHAEITDKEERQADAFALTMLRKGQSASLERSGRRLSAAELAVVATSAGRARGIDPGHLLLSYASEHDDWINANVALSYLPNTKTALAVLTEKFLANTDLHRLTEENRDHLLSAQGFG